jgi:hypothetical protein
MSGKHKVKNVQKPVEVKAPEVKPKTTNTKTKKNV